MSDINAAPSSTEPATAGDNVNATEVQAQAQEAGTAALGESTAAAPVAGAAIDPSAPSTSAATAPSTPSSDAADAPAVAVSGESVSGAEDKAFTSASLGSAGSTYVGAQTDSASSTNTGSASAADDPNAGASPAASQSASGTASSALGASLGDDTEAAALRAEIASLQQQLTDEQAEVAKWQGLYNAATASNAGHPIHSILSSIEAEIDRPAAILKSHVKSLLNDARALF